ncbi:MAG TPA: hypothetical protein VI141_05870 [Acidimicrobiia bacterium]
MAEAAPHIGTLREKPLHAALKRWYSRPGDGIEVPVGGFVIDLVRDGLLIEVQTSGFSSMRRKVSALLDQGHRIRIVHPVALDKDIVKLGPDGSIISRRRSPRHGNTTDVFRELVSFPELLTSANLEIEVLLTKEEEHRSHTPGRAWRRNGWTISERHLVEVTGSSLLSNPDDLAALLPAGLPDFFTTGELASGLGRPLRSAQQMAYCLRKTGVIVADGKRGNAVVYRVA